MASDKKGTSKAPSTGFFTALDRRLESFYKQRLWVFILLASLPLVVWQWPLVLSTNSLLSGDFDYFVQGYEAIRQSILHYHQFPWVNAWIGGGVPLYANPQMGVISIQTLLVLLFGSPFGLKLSIIIYSLIGFWGMFYLLRSNVKLSMTPSLALASLWATNGFFVAHLVSHYSFALFAVFPLLLYLLINITKRLYWLYFGLAVGLFILAAFHYAAFHGLLLLGTTAVFMLAKNWRKPKLYLGLYLKAGLVFLLVAGHRILYTVQFAFEYPRSFLDDPDSLSTALKSFVVPENQGFWFYDLLKVGKVNYSWTEHTAFVGYSFSIVVIILLIFCCIAYVKHLSSRRQHQGKPNQQSRNLFTAIGLGALIVLFIMISMGNFAPYSPYQLMQTLPAFSGMRVSSRWLVWAIFVSIVFVGIAIQLIKNSRLKAILSVLLVLGAIEVYAVGFANDKFFYKPIVFRDSNAAFEQFEDFDRYNLPKDLSNYQVRRSYDRRGEIYSYEATLNNFGQSRGYEPIVDTYYAPTARCGVNNGCNFIKTDNATVQYWSPNKIILKRTAAGPIELNMNPSSYWLANGQRLFPAARTVEVLQAFIINEEAETITLTVKPPKGSSLVKSARDKLSDYY